MHEAGDGEATASEALNWRQHYLLRHANDDENLQYYMELSQYLLLSTYNTVIYFIIDYFRPARGYQAIDEAVPYDLSSCFSYIYSSVLLY